jgi:integrase
MAPRTLSLIHATFGACLNCAVRTGKLARSPMSRLASTPTPGGEADHGVALEQHELRRLLHGFRDSVIYPIVVTLALTGARRSEVLALRWTDFDPVKKTLRIERAIEDSPGALRLKPPKTKRGVRTVALNDELVALLLAEREKHLRYIAGVPEGVDADLRLVRLPPDALIFPSSGGLTSLRHPDAVSLLFRTRARQLGFKIRLHDLRGSHATALLIDGHPPHAVAARIGDTVAVLLASYAKHIKSADDAMVTSVGKIAKAVL